MPSRLLVNWPYKLAALAIALALRSYVAHLNDPHTTKQINIPLSLTNVPDSLIVGQATPNVTLVLSGPASSLDSVTGTSYVARVDLHSANAGSNLPLPIVVQPTTTIPADVALDSEFPRMASISTENKVRQRFAVRVSFQRIAPAGFAYGSPSATPPSATVEGPETAVDKVSRLVVYGDDAVNGEAVTPGFLDGFAPIIAQDDHGNPVDGVNVLPTQAEVRVHVTHESAGKDLIVNANITGAPKYPAQITSVDVKPSKISVIGDPNQLSHSSVVDTAPVDITGATGDVTKTVTVTLPTGLKPAAGVTGPLTVQVTAHVGQTVQVGGGVVKAGQ